MDLLIRSMGVVIITLSRKRNHNDIPIIHYFNQSLFILRY
ncbi:hypothetical protein JCM19297_782 [Nonlabens ulvanivorans]|nr:hypothetical protein JCM19297_782 [Nonlabens ulvanivorans]